MHLNGTVLFLSLHYSENNYLYHFFYHLLLFNYCFYSFIGHVKNELEEGDIHSYYTKLLYTRGEAICYPSGRLLLSSRDDSFPCFFLCNRLIFI